MLMLINGYAFKTVIFVIVCYIPTTLFLSPPQGRNSDMSINILFKCTFYF